MTTHTFEARAEYSGAAGGAGRVSTKGFELGMSVPAALGGKGEGTNPEELIAGAAASCYAITFSFLAEKKKLPLARIHVASTCVVDSANGLRITEMTHTPRIVLAPSASLEDRALAAELAVIAEKACLISAALRGGGVTIRVELAVIVP